DIRELSTAPDEQGDPIGDAAHSPVPGVVHRYPDRVLLTPLLHCPVYCRYCFRRDRVGQDESVDLDPAFAYIEAHPAIWEVILTGGDPLMLPPRALKTIMERLDAIPHVEIIRFHTRVPVVDPGRITEALTQSLACGKAVWIAVHCNHPRELSGTA